MCHIILSFVACKALLWKVKWSRYRPGVAQRVRRGIALLFHDRSTRRGWVVSSTPRPQFTPGKDPVPILQEAGWAPVPVWTGGESRPHRDSIPDRPVRSQSLYRLSYRAHARLYYISANYLISGVIFWNKIYWTLTVILLMWKTWWAPNNASGWPMVFNSAFNPLTPNGLYSGRTAPLTSKVAFYIFIQQI